MAAYDRPYLTYEQQVELMVSRGLECASRDDAATMLAQIGYYRLSAYTYPFRKLLAPGAPEESPVQFRQAEFMPGYSIDHALSLYVFDHSLRMLCLDALKIVEVALRARVAYVLGKRDPFGYLERGALDEDTCRNHAPNGAEGDMFEYWMRCYADQQARATSEDFVRHYVHKYGGRLPVWVAVEVLDFGAITRLYSLLKREDQNEISRGWGVANARQLHSWLLTLGNVRNLCAHHSRLWNKNLTYAIGRFNPRIVGPDLRHISDFDRPKKLYAALAILAYLVTQIDPTTNWPRTLKTKVARKFPAIPGLSPETEMGFPSGWTEQPLWNYEPVKRDG